ncbi:MAG: glycosyltransferase [Bacteroidales bacterium]|nr:glycosyltransferase [Bacteroidales bacterium]MCF8390566.1 glycosyltransferase [Bacteroidales bacterium]
MKILNIGPAFPIRGGIATFNETLSLKLKEKGHKVTNYSYRFQYPDFLFPGKTQYVVDGNSPDLDIKTELHSVNFFTWGKTVRNIIREEAEIIIIHYWMPFFAPQLIYFLRKLKHKPAKVILLAHNLIPHEKQPGSRFLTRRLLKNVNGLLSLSDSVKKDALNFRKNLPTLVIPHPVYDVYGKSVPEHEAKSRLNLEENTSYILFFGLIRKYKGLDILLRALPLLKHKKLKLLVAGEFYDSREEYMDLVEELGISDRVSFFGNFIPDHQVKLFFSASELVVQPYRTATQSGVTQIAYHFGVPMVVTRVGGLPEIVEEGKTGFLSEVNENSLALAIDQFFSLKDRRSMQENVLFKAKSFSWNCFAEKLLGFADEL